MQSNSKSLIKGYYINLARNLDRRQEMELNLELAGLAHKFKRFDAIDGTKLGDRDTNISNSALGCSLSHMKILERNLSGLSHVHIIEDDALIEKECYPILEDQIDRLSKSNVEWDILYTNVMLLANISHDLGRLLQSSISNYKKTNEINLIDLSTVTFACTSSYVVNKNSVRKLYDMLEENYLKTPIDDLYRQICSQKALKVLCVIPFVTGMTDLSMESNIQLESRSKDNITYKLTENFRSSLYINSDVSKILANSKELNKDIAGLENNLSLDVYLELLKNDWSDKRSSF